MKYKSVLLAGMCFCISACAKDLKPDLLSIDDVILARESLNGRSISVTGFIVVDSLGSSSSFVKDVGQPRGDRVTKSIDIIPLNHNIELSLTKYDGRCVVLSGKFVVYEANTIRTGDLVSEYGYLDVRQARTCPRDRWGQSH